MGALAGVMVDSLHVNGHFSAAAAVANLAACGPEGRMCAAAAGVAPALIRLLNSSALDLEMTVDRVTLIT